MNRTRQYKRAYTHLMPSARMQLLVPRALAYRDLLDELHIDACVPKWLPEEALCSILGSRADNRVLRDVPLRKVRMHPEIFALSRLRTEARPRLSSRLTELIDARLGRIATSIRSPFVSGHQGGVLELFSAPNRRACIMEQFGPTRALHGQLTNQELKKFPGWQEPFGSPPWDLPRMKAEWAASDLVWCPTSRLRNFVVESGVPREKTAVIAYPVPKVPSQLRHLRTGGGRRHLLRVVFAGTLMLTKGVQYVYEGLRELQSHVDLHIYGRSLLSSYGMSKLAEVGTIHGPVSRIELLEAFFAADVLLLPAFAEGSALVSLEAAATGLPAIAAEGAGSPDSSMVIPDRDAQAIRDAVESVLDTPRLLEEMSSRCLLEANQRTEEHFMRHLASAAEALLATR